MQLGKVVGTVVASTVVEGLEGVPLLVVQPLDKTGKAKGGTVVCADSTGMAGPDELVYFEGGREARMKMRPMGLSLVGAFDPMLRGQKIADLIATCAAIDVVIPDIDR